MESRMCSLQVLTDGASYNFGRGDLGLKGKVHIVHGLEYAVFDLD